MAVRKPGIPTITTPDQNIGRVLQALKENVEIITGARTGFSTIATLPGDAALTTVIAKLNEVIGRINATGE